jgi:hypothetical protein
MGGTIQLPKEMTLWRFFMTLTGFSVGFYCLGFIVLSFLPAASRLIAAHLASQNALLLQK